MKKFSDNFTETIENLMDRDLEVTDEMVPIAPMPLRFSSRPVYTKHPRR